MAIFELVDGPPGQGKSYYTARNTERLVKRNMKWFQKSGIHRKVMSNMKMSERFEAFAGEFLGYWTTTYEIVKFRDVDLIWDEIATELDSRSFASLPEDLKRFLSQYRKRGVDIYANTQDFSMVDRRARLMVTDLYRLVKIIGSRDPSTTKPPVKKPWGLILKRQVKPEYLSADDLKSDDVKFEFIPDVLFITKHGIDLYNTRQDIPKSAPLPVVKKHTEIIYEGGEKDGKSEFKYF